MSTFTIKARSFAKHESGTKFYELIWLVNDSSGYHYVVRRYGKMQLARSGGAVHIDRGSMTIYSELQAQKRKGGYDFSEDTTGTIIERRHVGDSVGGSTVRTHYRGCSVKSGLPRPEDVFGDDYDEGEQDWSIPEKAVEPVPPPKIEGWGAW